MTSGTSSLLTAVLFVDDRKGWAVGARGPVCYSTDGGGTWEPQVISSQVPLYGIFFVSATHGWIVGGAGTVLHTMDGARRGAIRPAGPALLYMRYIS